MPAPKRRIPEVDAYIAAAPEFARPILKKLRALYHEGSPRMQEAIKWSAPFFECDGIVGSMAAFKQHVSFGFWRAKDMRDPLGILKGSGNTRMAVLKASTVKDLPADADFVAYVREAVRVNAEAAARPAEKRATKAPTKKKAPARKPAPKAPEDLLAALKKSRAALATFEGFPPSAKREYVEWVTEAKKPETRAKRVATAVEWMAEGKQRHWKYRK